MSNEIKVSLSLAYARTSTKAAAALAAAFYDDQVGDKYQEGIQAIGTVEEQLDKGDVGTISYLFVRVLDATNYAEFGATSGVYSAKVRPGKAALIPWDGAAIYAKANTAPVEVEYLIIEA